MTLFAVEGAAGCGKTFRLMEALGEALGATPLKEGQRVLALTFMHGGGVATSVEIGLRRFPAV